MNADLNNFSKYPEHIEHKKARLRRLRQVMCFDKVDRPLWLNSLSSAQMVVVNRWYKAWLDVTETLEIPETPDFIK